MAPKNEGDVKKGYYLLIFSTISLFEVVINGILGIFPGGIIGQGGMGQKFYLLPWFSQQLGKWNGQAFWTDAGFLSEQEFAFITLHIFLMYIGFAYLRRGNDPENDLRIDPKNWSWMENYPYLYRFFVPIVIMWFVIIYSLSLWIFIILFCGTLIFLFVKRK